MQGHLQVARAHLGMFRCAPPGGPLRTRERLARHRRESAQHLPEGHDRHETAEEGKDRRAQGHQPMQAACRRQQGEAHHERDACRRQ